MSCRVGNNLYIGSFNFGTRCNLLAIDDGFLGRNRSKHTGIIYDRYHGVAWYFRVYFSVVQIFIRLRHVYLETITLTLSEDRITKLVFITVIRKFDHINSIFFQGQCENWHLLLSESSVLHVWLNYGNSRNSTMLTNHLSAVLVLLHDTIYLNGVALKFVISSYRSINNRQVLCKDRLVVVISTSFKMDTFHLIFQRWKQSGELTVSFIGSDIDIEGFFSASSTISRALNVFGSTLHGNVVRAV